MATPSPGRTAVYRFYDASDQLLYVGVATNPPQRWAAHALDKDWWPEVAIREVEWFATRVEAETEEAKAIAEESPMWNKKSGNGRTMRGPVGRYWRPDADFERLVQRYKRTEAAAAAARASLETAIVREFKGGASATAIARHVPWPDKTILALAKTHGVPKLRKPTVTRLAKPESAE